MFVTNQKVVCVDDKFHPNFLKFYTALPENGKVYVVRGIAPGVAITGEEGELAVYVVGLHNPCSSIPPYRERGFKCERFRPLSELTEDEILALTKETSITA